MERKRSREGFKISPVKGGRGWRRPLDVRSELMNEPKRLQ